MVSGEEGALPAVKVSLKRKAGSGWYVHRLGGGSSEAPAKKVKGSQKKLKSEKPRGKNTLDSADGVGFTVSSVIGAVNATPEEMIKDFEGDIVEAEALLDMLSGNEESGTTTAEGATDCEVAGSESEVANDIPQRKLWKRAVSLKLSV